MKLKTLLLTASFTSLMLAGCSDDSKEKVKEDTAETEVFENGAVSKEENKQIETVQNTIKENKNVSEAMLELLSTEQIVKATITLKKSASEDEKAKIVEDTMALLEEKYPTYKPNIFTETKE